MFHWCAAGVLYSGVHRCAPHTGVAHLCGMDTMWHTYVDTTVKQFIVSSMAQLWHNYLWTGHDHDDDPIM